jgi:hypothetical protein
VLHRFEAARVDGLRDAVRVAQAAIRLAPMIPLRDEFPHAASAFAVKFSDIARRHRVLYGDDPFANLAIPRERLLARLLQVLLNLRLRLLSTYATRTFDESLSAGAAAADGRPRARRSCSPNARSSLAARSCPRCAG